MFKSIAYIALVFLLLTACDKHKAKSFAGTYSCTIDVSSFSITDGYSDTTFTGTLEVTSEGKEVIVNSNRIHVDSVRDGRTYSVSGQYGSFSVRFRNDSIYYFNHAGGNGGYSSSTTNGKKQ